jgi:hypothetical protein
MKYCALFFQMENSENKNQEENKTPSKMARLTWPKAKYGVYAAIIIIVLVNLLYYKDFLLSLI